MSPGGASRLARLACAYRATAYVVDLGPAEIALRIGRAEPALQKLIRHRGAGGAALITACNPGSRLRPEARNRAATKRLARDLRRRCRLLLPYRAMADAGDWPDESGLCAIGLGLAPALHLARRYGQIAIVWLPAQGSACLVFTAGFKCGANGRER